MVKVSVIVPVYNVEKYLEKCLDSLTMQSLKDIEIIVVNDGSPDNCQKIIDKYVQKNPDLIKAFIKENGGLSDARNYGIAKARGEYIGFVDSDDYVEATMFEKLYQKAKEDNYDIVVCDVNMVFPDQTRVISSCVEKDINTKEQIKKQMLNFYPTAWNKIYKRSLFENVLFKKGVWYEDTELIYKMFPYINSIGTVKEPLINYVQRNNSIIKTYDKRLYDYIDNFNGIVEFYKTNGFYDEYKKELEYCYVRYLYNTFIINACHFKKKDYKAAVEIAKKNVNEQFPHYRKNRYFYHHLSGIFMVTFCTLSANVLYYCNGFIKKIFLKH